MLFMYFVYAVISCKRKSNLVNLIRLQQTNVCLYVSIITAFHFFHVCVCVQRLTFSAVAICWNEMFKLSSCMRGEMKPVKFVLSLK